MSCRHKERIRFLVNSAEICKWSDGSRTMLACKDPEGFWCPECGAIRWPDQRRWTYPCPTEVLAAERAKTASLVAHWLRGLSSLMGQDVEREERRALEHAADAIEQGDYINSNTDAVDCTPSSVPVAGEGEVPSNDDALLRDAEREMGVYDGYLDKE